MTKLVTFSVCKLISSSSVISLTPGGRSFTEGIPFYFFECFFINLNAVSGVLSLVDSSFLLDIMTLI